VEQSSPSQLSPVAAGNDWKLVGVGSCTATGCHGGGHSDRIVGSEYNIWIAADPHAQAYSTLFDDRSLRMIQLLDALPPDSPVAPHTDARCLACHSMTHAEPADSRRDVLSDGVGCEACHGPAEGWLGTHFQHELAAGERDRLGLWNTDRLLVRAKVCTACHVGGPGREVNHDLIAAGHPRLQFEMGAYLDALPKHWLDTDDRRGREADFDAKLWAIGQACTSQAALEQLARRAEQGKSWPEFAEWSCSACHHDLRDETLRQQRLARQGGLSGRLIDWDTWNHFMSRGRAGELSQAFGLDRDSAAQVDTNVEALAARMRELTPPRQQVAELARRAASDLERFAAALEKSRIRQPSLERLMRSISARSAADDWSTAAQTYNALATLQETRLRSAPAGSQAVTNAIRRLYDDLAAKQRAPNTYVFHPKRVIRHLREVESHLPPPEAAP
jgi:hypothetical protein